MPPLQGEGTSANIVFLVCFKLLHKGSVMKNHQVAKEQVSLISTKFCLLRQEELPTNYPVKASGQRRSENIGRIMHRQEIADRRF